MAFRRDFARVGLARGEPSLIAPPGGQARLLGSDVDNESGRHA
jgi:hypothetical protein